MLALLRQLPHNLLPAYKTYDFGALSVNIEFNEKTIVVVGANRGIGYQVAKAFAESGGNVTIMAESEDIHAAAVKMSEETGKVITGQLCDITDISSLQNAFSNISCIDILVCNSGVGLRGPLSAPMEEVADNYRTAINVNVFGALMLTHIAAEKVQQRGHIIYTASTYSKAPQGDFVAYSATKHATLGIVRATAKELDQRALQSMPCARALFTMNCLKCQPKEPVKLPPTTLPISLSIKPLTVDPFK